MTAQTILNTIAIATISIFALSFIADFASTILQAWRASKPSLQQPEPAPEPQTEQRFASIDWVQAEEMPEMEEINVIELAKARMPKLSIVTLPQTEESEALEEWLSVAPSPYTTVRPEYSMLAAMTVKKLRQEAKIKNIKNAGSMTKAKLISAILAA